MNLVCFLPPDAPRGHQLEAALRARGQGERAEIHRTTASLADRLGKPSPVPLVVLLLADNMARMEEIWGLREVLADKPLIILVNQHPLPMLPIAHRLRPRFLAPLDTDLDHLMQVVENMLEREHKMEVAQPWPEAPLPPPL